MQTTDLIAGFLLGLMGAGHCMAMCGGIIASLSLSTSSSHTKSASSKPLWSLVISYQIGRIGSYFLFGILGGWFGWQLSYLTAIPVLKVISAILLMAMALYISRLWLGLHYLESIGKIFWKKISPLSKKYLPVSNCRQALLLGAIWGWLPCGLVYTALGYALSLGDSIASAAFMLAFGLGTLPATLFAGSTSASLKKWLNKKQVRWFSALIFLLLGFWSLYSLLTTVKTHHSL